MEGLPINALDLGIIVFVIISALLAFMRGFVHEILAIGAWIGAAIIAVYGLPYAQPKARELIGTPWIADAVAAGGLFLISLVVLAIITRIIAKGVQSSPFGSFDRALGALFGVVRGVFFVAITYIFVAWLMSEQDQPEWMQQAKLMPVIRDSAAVIKSAVPAEFLELGDEAIEKAKAEAEKAAEASRKAREAQEQLEKLSAPDPTRVPGEKTNGESPAYDRTERRELDRLIESTEPVSKGPATKAPATKAPETPTKR